MFSRNKCKIFVLFSLLILFVVGVVYYIFKVTYSNIVLEDVIVFDYSLEVDEEEKIIKYINNDTKVSEIINKISVNGDYSLNVSVTNSSGVEKDKTSVVVTGDLLVISVSDKSVKYEIAVRGDANGDGVVDLIDLIQVRKHIIEWKNPETGKIEKKTGVNLSAIDMDGDGDVNLVDLVKVRKVIVEIEDNIFLVKTDLDKVNLSVGGSQEIKYYVYPSNVSDKSVKWTSSDTNVATVSNGVIKAVGVGEAVITVTTIDSGEKDTVTVIVSETDYPQIMPTGNENIIYQENKDTLKVWIEQTSRNQRTGYYTTHIWVKDAYNQFKVQVPDNFGGELIKTDKLLENAVSQQKLENKLAVAVNASGFVLQGTYAVDIYAANNKYNMTSTSPLVLVNGVVKRDLSGETPNPWYFTVYGMNKSGKLAYYQYNSKVDTDTEETIAQKIEKNKKVTQKIKDDGVLNTFTFSPVLVYDGAIKLSDYYKGRGRNIRQGLCQIDSNNFVFITDIYDSARSGFSFEEMSEHMLDIGCKYGFSLDGGGSTALVYKPSSSSVVNVVNPGRQVADIIYFHE